MSYVSAKTAVVLNPDYFRNAALAYNANPTDRAQWLEKQKILLESAIYKYKVRIQELMNQGAKLDGQSDAAKWMTSIGSVAVVIPNVWVQAAGAIVSVAGAIVAAAERKKDSKALAALGKQAALIQLEAGQIKTYYDNYNSELQKIKLLPIALFGTAAYLFSK